MKTLYDALNFVGKGFDIGDGIFDFGIYFDYIKNPKNNYEKVIDFFAKNILFERYNVNWYSTCKISDFLYKNKKAFAIFMKNNNKENYQIHNISKITLKCNEMYDIFLPTFESLINGNYAESQYQELFKLLNQNKK